MAHSLRSLSLNTATPTPTPSPTVSNPELDTDSFPPSPTAATYASSNYPPPPNPFSLDSLAPVPMVQATPVLAALAALAALSSFKSQADLVHRKVEKVLNKGDLTYYLKLAAMGKKHAFLGDLEELSKLIKDAGGNSADWGALFHQEERKQLVKAAWDEAIAAITDLYWAIQRLPQDHPKQSKTIRKQILELLQSMTEDMDALVLSVRGFVGEQTTWTGARYGRAVHLVTLMKRCVSEWKDI